MNIQIYYVKKDFACQKAERFFKERRIPFQWVDLSKHSMGKREIMLFSGGNPAALVNRENNKVKEHPICYTDDAERICAYLMEDARLMRLPIVRNGQKFTIGADEAVWTEWVKQG